MPVQVANIWKHHRSPDEVRVYIGRACRGYPQSPLANPYRSSELGSKDLALQAYRDWLKSQLRDSQTPAALEILRLSQTALEEQVTLLCWCTPAPCHGDIVREAVEKLMVRLTQRAGTP